MQSRQQIQALREEVVQLQEQLSRWGGGTLQGALHAAGVTPWCPTSTQGMGREGGMWGGSDGVEKGGR